MRFPCRIVLSLLILACGWINAKVHAQEDLVAKAQKERELVVYGTALAAQFDKFSEPFRRRYPFIKTQYSRATGEELTTKILFEASAQQLSPDVVLINNYTHRIRSICAGSNSIPRTGHCRILMRNTTNFTATFFGQASKAFV